MALVCPQHHQQLDRGWSITMTNGIPRWSAPPWIDPAQMPRRNTAHHAPTRFATPEFVSS
jgi:hypothetical protein